MKKISVIFFLFFALLTKSTLAQNVSKENLKVFIDCKSWMCPFDFIRSEIKFVDYVNDRYSADVYVLLTSSATGSGGREYKLYFEGLGKFKSLNDTLPYIRSSVETDDEDRRKM